MDKTLKIIVIIDSKSKSTRLIAQIKRFILAKKPIIGGTPAIENIIINIPKAKAMLDFFNKDKSPNSLLYLIVSLLCFKFNNKKMDQKHVPAII